MANLKVVDADQLDADMTSLADTIRTKGGTSESLSFPDGMKAAVEAIEAGGAAFSEVSGTVGGTGDYVLEIPCPSDLTDINNIHEIVMIPGSIELENYLMFCGMLYCDGICKNAFAYDASINILSGITAYALDGITIDSSAGAVRISVNEMAGSTASIYFYRLRYYPEVSE